MADLDLVWKRDDPVGVALHFLRMSGVLYCRSELTAPWGIDLPAMPDTVMFHVVTTGGAWLVVDGEPARELRVGDMSLVSTGEGHVLLSAPDVKATPLFECDRDTTTEWFETLSIDGGGEATQLICGAVRFDDPAVRQLIELLPRTIMIASLQSSQMEWFRSTLNLLTAEAAARRPGHETVITRLADILIVQAIRHWIDADPAAQQGWLRGLRDRHVGRALALIHAEPARAWTLPDLAREVGLSRSAFSARFSELIGLPAMEYVTRWRIRVARSKLVEGAVPISKLAEEAGYESEAAFSRAFKRVTGVTPGSIRAKSGVL